MAHPTDHQTEEFLRLFSEHSRLIYSDIFRLVLSPSDADDIFQDTNLALWQEFDHFEPGTSFRAWSYRIAINRVLAWRKRQRRDRHLFSGVFLQAIAEELEPKSELLADQAKALGECLESLTHGNRQLISLRYDSQLEVPEIAERINRSVHAVYRALSRIRQKLIECTRKKLSSGDFSK